MKNLTQTLRYAVLGTVSALALLVIWSFIEPYRLNTKTEIAIIPNLPPSWQGQQIGQISDFQIGLWGDNRRTIRGSIAKLVEAKPAVALISGDFIYHSGSEMKPEVTAVVNLVRPLVEAGIPTYAVLGNHDYGMSNRSMPPKTEQAKGLEMALEAAGIEVLENESVALHLPDHNEPLYLVGVGSLWAKQVDIQQAFSGIPKNSPRIVMMHNPDLYEQLPPGSAPLTVAGHTHGGQVRLPGFPQWSWLRVVQKDQVYADGWIKKEDAPVNQLYVNPGLGMSIAPIRFFCPPQLTFFQLETGV